MAPGEEYGSCHACLARGGLFPALGQEVWENHDVGMASSPRLVRFVAVLFLLMAAVEVFGCDLLPSPACELSGPIGNPGSAPGSSQDECFCCCHHVVFGPPVVTFAQLESVEAIVPLVRTLVLTVYSPAIDQPPRA